MKLERVKTLVKISNKEIIDVIKYSNDKAIFVEKNPLLDGQYKITYFVLNFNNGEKEVITKNAYLLKKFGSGFNQITETISNYAECESAIFPDRSTFVIFSNGQAGLFANNGEMKWNGELKYNENPVNSVAMDGDYFWSCCKDENAVIRYGCENLKVDIRIGSNDSETFVKPSFVSADDENIYICCNESQVRKIDKSNFTVSDVKGIFNGIKRFYKFGEYYIICKYDGAYIDKP
jgi:hypothetical protein